MDFQHESLIFWNVFLHLLRHYNDTPPPFCLCKHNSPFKVKLYSQVWVWVDLILIVSGSDLVYKPLGRFSWNPLELSWNSAFGFCCEPFKVEECLSCSHFWSYLKYHQTSYSAWSHLDPGFLVEKYLHRDISSFKFCSFG